MFGNDRINIMTPCKRRRRRLLCKKAHNLHGLKESHINGTWETVGETMNSTGILKTFKRIVLETLPSENCNDYIFVRGYEEYKVLSGGVGHDGDGQPTSYDRENISGIYDPQTGELNLVETDELGVYKGSISNGNMILLFLQAGKKHVVSKMRLQKMQTP